MSDEKPPLVSADEAAGMRRLARRLRRSNPIRSVVERLAGGEELTADDRSAILGALGRTSASRWRERACAAWAAGIVSLTGADRDRAVPRLIAAVQRRHGEPRLVLRPNPPLLLAWMLAMLVVVCWWRASGSVGSLQSVLSIAATMAIVLPFIGSDAEPNNARVRAEAARALGRLEAGEALGALAQQAAEGRGQPRLRQARARANEALCRLLALLVPGERPVDDDTMKVFCRLLVDPDEDLVVAALQALGRVGDARAITAVERVGKRGRSARLKAEAGPVLAALRARLREAQAPQRLLRAAEPPSDTGRLLRPVQGVQDVDPHLLLRPTEQPGPAASAE